MNAIRSLRLLACAGLSLGAGATAHAQTYDGALTVGDPQLDQGEYYDAYEIQATLGQAIEVDMTSDSFDTFLVLFTPSGQNTQNDDFEQDAHRSRLDMMAKESGTYRVIATSYAGEETGPYRLVVRIDGASEPAAPPVASATPGASSPSALTGFWVHGSPSAIQYVDRYTGESAPTNGLGTFLELHADGTYRYGGLLQLTTYSCTSVLYRDDAGTYTAEGNELVLHRTSGRSWGRVCGGQESERTLDPETERYTFELSDGDRTLTRYADGAYYDQHRRGD